MNPESKILDIESEVRSLRREMATFKQAITIDTNTIILQKPVIIRGATNINGITIFTGNGSPEGVITANIGSIYLRLNGGSGSTLYVKESGTGKTGWSTTA